MKLKFKSTTHLRFQAAKKGRCVKCKKDFPMKQMKENIGKAGYLCKDCYKAAKENKKEAAIKVADAPINVNTADEIKPGDILQIGKDCMLKFLTNFISLKDNEVKVKWSEKHPEGVLTEEGSLSDFKKRILVLKDTYRASVIKAAAGVNFPE